MLVPLMLSLIMVRSPTAANPCEPKQAFKTWVCEGMQLGVCFVMDLGCLFDCKPCVWILSLPFFFVVSVGTFFLLWFLPARGGVEVFCVVRSAS